MNDSATEIDVVNERHACSIARSFQPDPSIDEKKCWRLKHPLYIG